MSALHTPRVPMNGAQNLWRQGAGLVRLCIFCLGAALLASLLWPAVAQAAAEKNAPATTQQSALLGLNLGLAVGNQQDQFVVAQKLAALIGKAAQRKIIWETGFNLAKLKTAGSNGALPFSFAFVKPPNLTAALLAKGWRLVAVGQNTLHFGTDLIAQSCPGQPGKVLLGGSSLSILGMNALPAQVCVSPAQVWQSPSAVMLAPQQGSLVDLVAQKIWREHGGLPRHISRVNTQNAVIGLMRDLHVAAVGVVTPVVSKAWADQGGIVLAHQPMPFWALMAAPDVPVQQIEAVRSALLGGSASEVNRALHIPGWEVGDAKPYADFLKWLKG